MLCSKEIKSEIDCILHLPFIERITHKKARRVLIVMAVGAFLMLLGSLIANYRADISEIIPVHHIMIDTGGYFLHAIGALPILRYIEPFWTLLLGEI